MASTAVECEAGADFNSCIQSMQASEPCHSTGEGKWCVDSASSFPSAADYESLCASYKFGYSSFNTRNEAEITDSSTPRNGDQNMSFFDQKQTTRTSGPANLEMHFGDATYQKKSSADQRWQSSMEDLQRGNMDSGKQGNMTPFEMSNDKKWDFSNDYTSVTFNKPNVGGAYEPTKQNYESFTTPELQPADFKSKSNTFDFDLMKQTYNFDSPKGISRAVERDPDNTRLPSRSSYDFQATELALRLRTSMQSDFLSKELGQGSTSKKEEHKFETSGAIRTIEEILKQHGISDNVPRTANASTEDGNNKPTNASARGHVDSTQNNESSSRLASTAGSGTTVSSSSTQENNNPANTYSNKNLTSQFKMDVKINSMYPESMNSPSTHRFMANVSQNNETSKSENGAEADPLRKFGSSVDYSTSSKLGMRSGSSSFRMVDYGKSTSYSGDLSRPSTFATMESKQFEGNLDRSKFEGAQSEIGRSTFDPSKDSHIDIIHKLGSATDALEYSMSAERQRLRKLDTLISATPFNYTSLELPRSMRAQYMSPERGYSSLNSSDLINRKHFSTSMIPSTSGVSHKGNFGRSVGQRSSTTSVNKSTSAPGTAHGKSEVSYGSSVDARSPYWSYGSTMDRNQQYNNAYSQHFRGHKNCSANQKKAPVTKKKECPLKTKKESEKNRGSENQLFYQQTPTGIKFLNSTRAEKTSTAEKKKYSMKPETKKGSFLKKGANSDFSHSKNNSFYDGFDFAKDLNRMWQETVFGATSLAKSGQLNKKYTPYKPASSSQDKKEMKPRGVLTARDILSNNFMQSSVKHSDSNWTVTDAFASSGKFPNYDPGFKSVQKVRSNCSIEPNRKTQGHAKGSTGSVAKLKTNSSSGSTGKHTPTAPKSILKHPSNKTNYTSTTLNRSNSVMATGSRSFTQTAGKMPYELARAFSPADQHKIGRPHTATSAKKSDSLVKRNTCTRAYGTPKQGRRL